VVGAKRVEQLMTKKQWHARGVFLHRIDERIKTGVLREAERETEIRHRVRGLYTSMSQLAFSELVANGNCITCNGSGRTRDYRTCANCKGTGKKPWPENYKADFCFIEYETWRVTWSARYNQVFLMFQGWLTEFERHLIQYCR